MKKPIITSCAALVAASLFSSCATTQRAPNAVTRTGQDLTTLAAQAFQAYTDAKDGDTNYLWSIYKGLSTLGPTAVQTKADLAAVVKQWGDSKVDTATGKNKSLVARLTELFNSSDADPASKTEAIAKAASAVAQNKAP